MLLVWPSLRSTWLLVSTNQTVRLWTTTRNYFLFLDFCFHESNLGLKYIKSGLAFVLLLYFRYAILGDGCQMEGIANEACSLAGHWGLGKLIAFYDDNHISIDGDTEIAFTESVDKRFEGLGWHVIWVKNGNTGYDEIRAAIKEAKAVTDKPTLIKASNLLHLSNCLIR